MHKRRVVKYNPIYSREIQSHGAKYTAIAILSLPLLLGLSTSVSGAQTVLTSGQDVFTNGLNTGAYDLFLDGDVSWRTVFVVNSAARSNIVIDGNGHIITAAGVSTQRFLNIFQNNSNITLKNAIFTSQPFTGPRYSLLKIETGNVTANINLEGTTFQDIGPTDYNSFASADYGNIIGIRTGSNSVMNIDGGVTGVNFLRNHGLADQPGVVGLYAQNTINFLGKVNFEGNWTGDYGGAVSVYDVAGSVMNFAGETSFINNHSSVFGGAIDSWGGAANITFNGSTLFSDNYVYGTTVNSPNYPEHVDDQHTRGGAINIGYLNPGASGVNLTFNGNTKFIGNYVIDPKNNFNALGGAVSAYGNGGNYNYLMSFNGATTFDGNYVYSLTGSGYGGAIYYDAGTAATLNLGPGSSVINNYAKTLGGAIYLQTGTINLKAEGGDITFEGNRQAASFTSIGGGLFAPVIGSGNPNAIYLGSTGSLNMNTSANNAIYFYDPIASAAGATITVNKNGDGQVIFRGNSSSPGDPLYNSLIRTNTNVNGGTFSLTDSVIYGVVGSGIFATNSGGTVVGNNGSTLRAQNININSGGTISANGGIFNLEATSVTSSGGNFSGSGSIVAPTISLSTTVSNISTANIASGNTLNLDSVLTNAGGLSKTGDGTLVLTKTNTYSGATSIGAGTLQADTTNIIAASSGLSMSGGVFDLHSFNQTLKSLSGSAGAITTGTGVLTVDSNTSTSYAGSVSGNGKMIKQGTGTLTLLGSVSLLDATSVLQVNAGSLVGSSSSNNIQTTKVAINSGSQLLLLNSASLSTATLSVGDSTTGNNTVSVITGAHASVTDNLYLGFFNGSTGVLNINGAGSLVDATNVQVGYGATSSGTINLNSNGTLQAESLNRGAGTTGSVVFDNGILRAKADNSSFINGFSAGDLLLNAGGGTVDSNGFNIATNNVFSGTGKLTKAGAGIFTLTGLNTYTGGTSVSGGTLRLTGAGTLSSGAVDIGSGSTLFIDNTATGNYSFNNLLSGTGLLQVDLLSGSNTFQFGSGTGSAFSGILQLNDSRFLLSASNTSALTNATLALNSGNTTVVGVNSQDIGGLTLNGGELRFENLASGIINTQKLALNSGTVVIDPEVLTNGQGSSILAQDKGIDFRLVNATEVSGSASNLTMTDLSGNAVIDTADIIQGSVVATGTYDFSLDNDSNGLYTTYRLVELDLLAGQTTALSSPLGMETLYAKVTGSGNLLISNGLNSITLNNGANNYTGSTEVATGTLFVGADHALGNTSNLIIDSGATANINGKTQTVGSLNNNGTLDVNAGNLSITQGGSFGGGVIGSTGNLNLLGGSLVLSGNNTYTGNTQVNSGSSLQIGNGGASGSYAGNISNNGVVAFNRTGSSTYQGAISGGGVLQHNGSGTLTLSGINTYSGGSSISAGTVIATQGAALGSGLVTNNGLLQLAFAGNSQLANVLTGSGDLTKSGSGIATLTGLGSSQDAVSVDAGTLSFAQVGAFNANSLTTASNATTSLAANSSLNLSGALTQVGDSILNVTLGSITPVITAGSASLSGTLKVSGINTSAPTTNASDLQNTNVVLIHTTAGISNDFTDIDLSGAASTVDYLSVIAGKSANNNDYNVGLGLTWLAGSTSGNGIFTLTSPTDIFNVDMVLADQTASATGWNGKLLTKNGAGTLVLSSTNTYSGDTLINQGVLQAGIANAFADSANVTVNSGAMLDLNNLAQRANNLSGEGGVTLGSAALTAHNTVDTTFDGNITGSGSLIKTGSEILILTGINGYSGGTSLVDGRLSATRAQALGTGNITNNGILQLDFADNSTLANLLGGTGSLIKSGVGVATLTNNSSTQGAVEVNAGTLNLAQSGAFNAASLITANNATTVLASGSTLNLSGALTQSLGSELRLTVNAAQPVIVANNAVLSGTLNVTGFNATEPTSASMLAGTEFNVLHTNTANGISGSFTSVNFNGVTSPVDYLTLAGRVVNNQDYNVGFGLTWLAGPTASNGAFTLVAPADFFNVDVILADQTVTSPNLWDGKSLIKNGAGTLQLSSVNTYTGGTLINAGTLRTGIANAFAGSDNVTIASGAILDLNNFSQQAGNLSGSGQVTLGSAALTANNTASSQFDGVISGSGSLIKTGSGALTLTGINDYSGGSTLSAGTVMITQGQALGTGSVANNTGSVLQLNFAGNSTLANILGGTGSLVKTGGGVATLTGAGSTQGEVAVNQGTLSFTQTGTFNAASLTTEGTGTTSLAANSTLNLTGALTQKADAILNVVVGTSQPAINAGSAVLDGVLNITGFSAGAPSSASGLTSTEFTVLHTSGVISGDFSQVDLGGSASLVDYLTLAGRIVNNQDYNVGFGLAWLAGPTASNGAFTLVAPADFFNVDVILADQTVTSPNLWDGQSLTKNGSGTLQLSSVNTYTGDTLINGGTLRTGVANAFTSSANISVGSGATLDLNSFAQQAGNLSGSGQVTLGSAALTANNTASSQFDGVISGSGSLIKTGSGALTLTGINDYGGGSTLNAGTVIVTQGQALGTGSVANNTGSVLQLNFAGNSTLANILGGTGSLVKTGDGVATLTGAGSTQGAVAVNQGTLSFTQTGTFNAASLTTEGTGTTSLAANSTLNLTGVLTQKADAILNVAVGTSQPAINAGSAVLDGVLNITGFSAGAPSSASGLTSTEFTVLHTSGVISGDFSQVDLGGSASSVDYLTLAGRIVNNQDYNVGFGLTWLAGPTASNGAFTLVAPADFFNVDVILADQTVTSPNLWDGKTLTKNGAGTLQLSSINTYTGDTLINGGTLRAGVANAFTSSANITVGSGATLDLNSFAQQAGNLSGSGQVTLGSAALTANNTASSQFDGVISGSGSLIKTGSGALTLTGINDYSGGSTLNAGTVIVTQGQALGTGSVANNTGSVLQLNFAGNSTLANILGGTGSLVKTGSGVATLTGAGSTQGAVAVNQGILSFTQTGTFNAASLTTEGTGTTSLAANSTLNLTGALTQKTDAILNVAVGTTQPAIEADSAALAGTLNVTGLTVGSSVSDTDEFTVLHTLNGITGDFDHVDLGGAASPVDFMTLGGRVAGNDYNVGFGLTWLEGPSIKHGTFTVINDFDIDVILANQTASVATGWNGQTLTKNGAGTLQLSRANTYSGDTLINAGTLRAGIANAFANSTNVVVVSGATLDLNNFAQQVGNLAGSGQVTLGNAALTANNTLGSQFNGVISGSGSLNKIGSGVLTLTGVNDYSGGSTLNAGRVIASQGQALGSGTVTNNTNSVLQLNFTANSTLANILGGSGSLIKTGGGVATLTGAGSTQGAVTVENGTLSFGQTGVFNAGSLTTLINSATTVVANASLNIAGGLTQNSGSTLNVAVGNVQPVITADSVALGGTLNITGFTAQAPTNASTLTNTEFTVLHSNNVISGNFDLVSLGGAASTVDYLTLAGRIVNNYDYNVGFGLTWLAGPTTSNGAFTLTAPADFFNVDVILADQTVTSPNPWDGKSLTKNGAGTLQLSSVNTYTGETLINGGTLRAGIANAFTNSANITVGSGATLDLNGFSQQANHLSGSGQVTLGSAALTANNTVNSQFDGVMSGSGSLNKTGSGVLTLTGVNGYSGGSTLNAGRVIASQGQALGTGAITNNFGSVLQLNFAANSTLANILAGTGSLVKTGSGVATVTGAGSTQGAVSVENGTLSFGQTGAFNAGSLTTFNNAATTVVANSSLNITGTLTQNSGSTLNVAVGNVQPVITASNASLSGTLNITGFTAQAPTNASTLTSTEFTVLHSNNIISGNFNQVSLGGAASTVDYLTLAGQIVNDYDYKVGFGLTWLGGPTLGNGLFTLAEPTDLFNVDVVLADQSAVVATGWNGKTLTKNGAGTLQLSSVNTYTGDTLINGGTLRAGIANAFTNSANVTVGSGATLDLNSFAQQAGNLSGSGQITLGSAALTANNTANSQFDGVISGSGSLNKTGSGALTLTGVNGYSGGSTLNAGRVIITQGQALGTGAVIGNIGSVLQLNFAANSTLANILAGNGSLVKTGGGSATLTGSGSAQGAVMVDAGTLRFGQNGIFNATSLTTENNAAVTLVADSGLNLTGALTQNFGSALNVAIGNIEPTITADTASLSGALNITGFITGMPTNASVLTNTNFTVLRTANGISGDFTSINLGGAVSTVDYLRLSSGKSADNKEYNLGFGLTWMAGNTLGNGTFTLTNPLDTFNVDVVLADQVASATGWNGSTLTKNGEGTLVLSSVNTYTGNTIINDGTLQAGVENAFLNSANVIVNNSGVFDLDDFDQVANNLSGSGGITLGNADLTVNSLAATSFNGSLSGNGGLIKTGTEALTLTGVNFYSGTTTVNQGRLIGTHGSSLGLAEIDNQAELELAFEQNEIVNNQLSGSGSLIKSGAGIGSLTASGSSQGDVQVNGGTLQFTQNGSFGAVSYNTASGATTQLAADSSLLITGNANTEGRLDIVAGNTSPVVTADTASIGSNAIFNLSGYSAPESTSATQLAENQFRVIQTSGAGNLTGNFSTVSLGGSTSPVDYLTMTATNDGQNYDIGLALTWYAAHTITPEHALGTFTLSAANEFFDLDVLLADETANATTGWDGKTLTKAGAGTLQLSKSNTYTGSTLINGGTLLAGGTDIIADSSKVTVASGANFDLNHFNQRVNNLSGAGNVILGDAILTTNNTVDNTFSGVISGAGGMNKTGSGTLFLTGNNAYVGGATITEGTLQLGNGGTGGSLVSDITNNGLLIFNRSDDYLYNNVISGSGDVIQQGPGRVYFAKNETYAGKTDVNAGALILTNNVLLTSTQPVTVARGAIFGGYGGVNGDVVNHGLLAVADAAPGYSNAPAGNFTVGGNMTNSGEIRMESPAPASQLLVKGNYVGNNGLLTLSTVLGGDNSLTDKLVVQGNTSGSTNVVVNSAGGAGAQTVNGIEIISVAGQSNGLFTLVNRVVAGPYEYALYQGKPNSPDGNWYLRSEGPGDVPQWRPESGAYLGNQMLASQLQMLTLYDRQGSQFNSADTGAWGRIITGKVDSKAANGSVDISSDYTLVQLGGDVWNIGDGVQGLSVGVMGSWGNGDTDSSGNADLNGKHHTANGSIDGFSLGMYATWFADVKQQQGAYLDSWIQYGWYNNDVSGEGAGTDSYHSRPWATSLETGYRIVLNEDNPGAQWSLIPQAQVIYNKYSADSFVDSSGTAIDGQNNDMWRTRIGARVAGRIENNGHLYHPFTELNWWHTGQNASVTFDRQRVEQDIPDNMAELKFGIQGEFDANWSSWINVGLQTGPDDYQNVSGGVGVRYVW